MEITPKTGDDKKFLCCTFAHDVEEYGEVIEGLALGCDPADKSWFLAQEHDKNIVFPIKPARDLYEEIDRAEISSMTKEEIEAIGKRLNKEVPEDTFAKHLEDCGNVSQNTTCHHQTLLRLYERAKSAGYNMDEHGDFYIWLFERSARLLETGSPELVPLPR